MSSSAATPHDFPSQPTSTGFVLGVGRVAWTTILTMTLLGSAGVAGALMGVAISYRDLPDVRSLTTYTPNETTYIYDINGKLLTGLHEEENRQVVPLDKISPHLKLSVLAIEDSNFYQHNGINPVGILR
uniref:transglycosylase domain-containing protein n=1 Tax=Acaryochloris sp. IP29b_bin.148 TaxID=2969218 RepID=UPI00262E3485